MQTNKVANGPEPQIKQANKSDTSNFTFSKDQILETADIYGQVFIVNM